MKQFGVFFARVIYFVFMFLLGSFLAEPRRLSFIAHDIACIVKIVDLAIAYTIDKITYVLSSVL